MSEILYPIPSDLERKIIIPRRKWWGLVEVSPVKQAAKAILLMHRVDKYSHQIRNQVDDPEKYPVFGRVWKNHKGDYRGYGLYKVNLFNLEDLKELNINCVDLFQLAFDPEYSNHTEIPDLLDEIAKWRN